MLIGDVAQAVRTVRHIGAHPRPYSEVAAGVNKSAGLVTPRKTLARSPAVSKFYLLLVKMFPLRPEVGLSPPTLHACGHLSYAVHPLVWTKTLSARTR